ncbi:MAG: hypothetical protein N3B16_01545 [Candidatus Aminicenantes bacterium]|nr:hypothetical protein [Candidatus Aminicenantes bacterium]
MKKIFIQETYRRIISHFLVTLFIFLGLHFHESEQVSHFHVHNLTLTMVNQTSVKVINDGHICPCFVATLDMPMRNIYSSTSLIEAKLNGLFLINFFLPLIWEIFHPPRNV